MHLRRLLRAAALALALLRCLFRLAFKRLRGRLTPVQRALWLQSACRAVLRAMGVNTCVIGEPPSHGLVVSNHLSYLDIAAYSSVMPCFFVSKAEVRNWPYFGFAASAGGTIFLDRSSRASAGVAAAEICQRLQLAVPVLLFPEGTSTDGSAVLRFHSALFHPAIQMHAPVTAAALQYICETSLPERELCWFGDAGFLPHLWKILGMPALTAVITFDKPTVYADRRTAATITNQRVSTMRAEEVAELPVYA
ncbi:MAG TPA: lysophospholipid acyltransferase family protein [Terracidiphilus sp.]